MPKKVGVFVLILISVLCLFIILFGMLATLYLPFNRYLFGGEIPVAFDEIQFSFKKAPHGNYYWVDARYLRRPAEFAGGIYFTLQDKKWEGGWRIIFSPIDNKIYGGGWWEKAIYHLGEGKIEAGVFKPTFLEGTKFTFLQYGKLELTDAPRNFITIHLPSTLKKLTQEELGVSSLAEIVKEETKIKK